MGLRGAPGDAAHRRSVRELSPRKPVLDDKLFSPHLPTLDPIIVVDNHDHAADSYRKAIDLDPKWVFPQVNLAGVYLHDKQWDLAEQGYLKAIQTDGTYATAWYFLGQTYEAQKRPSDAVAAYEKAVQLAATRPSSAFKSDIVQRHVEKLKLKLPTH